MTVTPSAISLPAAQIYTDCASDLNHLITLLSAGTSNLDFHLFCSSSVSFFSFFLPSPEAEFWSAAAEALS